MSEEAYHLLLVEDNPDQVEMVKYRFLKQNPPPKITVVTSGQACLESLSKDQFSAVLLDYSLPGMTGLQVLEEILHRKHDVPVIMVTGRGDETLAVEAMKKVANLDTIKALGGALETKDLNTKGHSDRTVALALAVTRRLGLSEQEQEWAQYTAILHDIGKIGIPESILNKPAKLTPEEFEVMKRHPELGCEIISQIEFLAPVVPLVRADHERWDGRGYPDGLAGEAIPLIARIVGVVDAYDAMTSDRIYRKAPGKAYAIQELKRCAGTQFDPKVVEALLECIGATGS